MLVPSLLPEAVPYQGLREKIDNCRKNEGQAAKTPNRKEKARLEGFEPPTQGLGNPCSIP